MREWTESGQSIGILLLYPSKNIRLEAVRVEQVHSQCEAKQNLTTSEAISETNENISMTGQKNKRVFIFLLVYNTHNAF